MNVVGNYYDKYSTRNPVGRLLMRRFLGTVTQLYRDASPTSVLEVGCGEGQLARHLYGAAEAPQRFAICDLDIQRIGSDLPGAIEVSQASIYELPFDDDAFDLLVCCEVLEHLDNPAAGLAELARVAKRRVLLSTPWEPVWRALNIARGAYWRELGNTPGHVQHFTRRALLRLAGHHLRILEVRTPLPWTIVLGEPLR